MLVHLGDKKEESSSTPAPWFLEFLALTNLMLLLTGNTFLTIKMESGVEGLTKAVQVGRNHHQLHNNQSNRSDYYSCCNKGSSDIGSRQENSKQQYRQ